MSAGPERLVLRGGPISPFVRKVGIAIVELGLVPRIDFVRSLTAAVQVNAELQRHNPLSKIPTLIKADGSALFDSDVICEYLDATFVPSRLFPRAGSARWQALRWNALGSGALDVLVLWRFERNRPISQQSPQVLHAYEAKLMAVLHLLETEMPGLAQALFAIGHIPIGCFFGYLDFRFPGLDWRRDHPRCTAWFGEEFMARDSARRTVPYETAPPAEMPAPVWPPLASP